MKFPWSKKQQEVPTLKANLPSPPAGDTAYVPSQENGQFKAYIPGFLYKPPFGYPRPENLPLIRQTAKNPYVYSIVKTISDEIASANWEILPKNGVELTPELEAKQKEITDFFSNPNGNQESFAEILRAVTKDILELDSGVIVKVFNEQAKLVQIFARDGGSFLKNPNIYGYMGDRADIIEPVDTQEFDSYGEEEKINYYNLNYREQAAYFQYGWTSASMPIPWGKKEIMYMMQNPRTDSIYGQSPIAILADVLYTLIYGSKYNLDFYMNNNMPEGMISIIGAGAGELKAAKERFEQQFREKDETTGFMRRVGFKIPWSNRETKFTPFTLDPKTMQVLEQQEWFTKVAWMCFGVTAEEMGFTENSNKAVSESQHQIAQRKAARPIFKTIEYHVNQSLIPEFDTQDLEFKFVHYNVDEELKKYDLYMKKQQVGVATPEMIAEEEGIDVTKIKEAQERQRELEDREFSNPKKEDKKEEDKEAKVKALLIKEVPDNIDEQTEFMEGDLVKVIEGSNDYMDKKGRIELLKENSAVVRFDVGVDIFSLKQLAKIDEDSDIDNLKAKDPFNNTEIEKSVMKEISDAGRLVKEALNSYKGGKIDRYN